MTTLTLRLPCRLCGAALLLVMLACNGSGVTSPSTGGLRRTAATSEVSDLLTLTGRIAFASNRAGNFEIYVMNANGTGVTRITHNSAFDDEPAWSPDGTKLAFVSERAGNAEIYVMNANGTGVTRLTNNPAIDEEPAWGP